MESEQRRLMPALLRHVLGWGSLAVGIAGLVLPVLPGWVLIGVGAVLLAPDVPIFGRLLSLIQHRFPAVRAAVERLQRRIGGV